MAFSKKQKGEMIAQYEDLLNKSQGIFVLEYKKMTQKEIDTLRAKVREAGGEFHVVKNTLMTVALERHGVTGDKIFDGASVAGFALSDAPAIAKIFGDATRNAEMFKLKGGYLGKQSINASQVKSLADLPPLPVMRARLLGVLQAPAAQLARTIAEPARGLASVFRAYSEKDKAAAEAA
ncbi:MAG TPA: 50S ribosomal protein L10 [Anaerolineaceae bacterium]